MDREWQEAAESGDADALVHAIERGASIDSLDRYGQTALMLAARNGQLEAVWVLVKAGAGLDHTAKYSLSALMLATLNNHTEIVKLLVDYGANTQLLATGAAGFAGKAARELAADLGYDAITALLE